MAIRGGGPGGREAPVWARRVGTRDPRRAGSFPEGSVGRRCEEGGPLLWKRAKVCRFGNLSVFVTQGSGVLFKGRAGRSGARNRHLIVSATARQLGLLRDYFSSRPAPYPQRC